MRKLSSHYIMTGNGDILNKGVIILDDTGVVTDVIDTHGKLEESAGIEFYSGVMTPGFVNAHCHLELSHLKGVFPEKSGLSGFLKNVIEHRESDEKEITLAAQKADFELWKNGVVAVGDISNNAGTFPIKSKSLVTYHTFIELLGFSPLRAEKAFDYGLSLLEQCREFGLNASIVPHAPYSISKALFEKIKTYATPNSSLLSIHNQESSGEDELYRSGTGSIAQHLSDHLHLDLSLFTPTGRSALESVLQWIPKENPLLLVHNLQTGQKDIDLIKASRDLRKTWFVLCPNSNLYIEERLPDIDLFRKNNLMLCLGTDSLSSNHTLSILDEMKTIQHYYPTMGFDEMVIWATRNGAQALQMDQWAGTIEKGKRPGINLITGMELNHLKLLPQSKVKRLV